MIEFHESEYFQSPLEDRTLRAILAFVPDLIPREVYDQLLYRGKKYVRFPYRRNQHLNQARVKRNYVSGYRISAVKESNSKEINQAQRKEGNEKVVSVLI